MGTTLYVASDQSRFSVAAQLAMLCVASQPPRIGITREIAPLRIPAESPSLVRAIQLAGLGIPAELTWIHARTLDDCVSGHEDALGERARITTHISRRRNRRARTCLARSARRQHRDRDGERD